MGQIVLYLHARWEREGRPIPQGVGWRWSYIALRAALQAQRIMSWFRRGVRVKDKKAEVPEQKTKAAPSTLGKKPKTPQHKGQLLGRVERLLKNRGC